MTQIPMITNASMAFAEIALGQIKAFATAGNATHYEIWYLYAQGPDLAHRGVPFVRGIHTRSTKPWARQDGTLTDAAISSVSSLYSTTLRPAALSLLPESATRSKIVGLGGPMCARH